MTRISNFLASRASIIFAAAILALLGAFPFATGIPSAHAQDTNIAQLRVIHTVFDAPAVDIYLNGNKAVSGLAYKDIGPRVALPSGNYSVKVTPAGKTDSIIATDITLESGKSYSFVAIGRFADLGARVLEDNLSPLASGQTRLRLVHASPDTPAVDVAIKDGGVLYPNLGLGEASNYFPLAAAPVNVEVRPAGTTTVALSVPSLVLKSETSYTVYVVGLSSGSPGLSTLMVADSVTSSSVSQVLPATGTSSGSTLNSTLPKTGVGDLPPVSAILALLAAICLLAGVTIRVNRYNRSRR